MKEYIAGLLYGTQRPGYPAKNVVEESVAEWTDNAKKRGIRTIICLLDDEHLSYYQALPGGLLKFYSLAGFTVVHWPIKDHLSPPVPEDVMVRAYSDFLLAEKPVLVHCSAGIGRTGALVNCLKDEGADIFSAVIENCMRLFSGGRSPEHFRRVTRLAMRLYDLLEPRHQLLPRFRTVLWAAAMLHDIGTDPRLGNDPESHAWRSADKILKANIHCSLASALEIATVASLHRREGGNEYGALGEVYGPVMNGLGLKPIFTELLKVAAILRVADGLDRYPPVTITDIRLDGSAIVVEGTDSGFQDSLRQAVKKSPLLVEKLKVSVHTNSMFRYRGLRTSRE